MIPRFSQFPAALASRTQHARLGPMRVPSLLSHPDWERPAPVVLWMHGRTVSKELDPGRYLRWLRAGIAACAVDLPGHGERLDPVLQTPRRTLDVIAQMRAEIDGVVAALSAPEYKGIFDLGRIAIGGMSAGGMVALRRLCDPHPFSCVAVECTTGWLEGLYFPEAGMPAAVGRFLEHDPARVAPLDPMRHLATWRPVPLLALHVEADEVVPFATMERFLDSLRARHRACGASESMIELATWDSTGSPQEHAGFGRFSNDAKNLQTAFLAEHLRATPVDLDATA